MAVNVFQVNQINGDLFSSGATPASAGIYASEYSLFPDNINGNLSRYTKIGGLWPSAVQNNTAGYPAGSGGNSSWSQPNGLGIAGRPSGGYYVRSVLTTDQNPATLSNTSTNQYISYGYIGSFVGGYGLLDYTFDVNPGPVSGNQISAVDYEPPYGHGTSSTIANAPVNNVYQTQWRDSSNLTVDSTAQLTLTGSAYSRSPYAKPASFVAQMDAATNTLGSGNLTFHIEMRPTQLGSAPTINNQGTNALFPATGSRSPFRTDQYGFPFNGLPADFYYMSNNRKFGSRALSIFWGRIIDGQSTAFAYPYYEDQTFATYLNSQPGGPNIGGQSAYADHVYASSAIADCPTNRAPAFTHDWLPGTVYALNFQIIDPFGHIQTVSTGGTSGAQRPTFNNSGSTTTDNTVVWQDSGLTGVVGALGYQTDSRVRNAATIHMNDEYDLYVQETKFAIVSNKTTMYPLVFLDLLDTWNSGTWAAGFRIAGATVWSETTAWVTATVYAAGQAILDPNGNIQVVTTGGTSGGTIPTFNATYNGTTPSDGSVTWTNYGANRSKIFFVSENGHLAVFDSNVANSSVTALTSASAPASGSAYGAVRIRTGFASLYAVSGCFTANPNAQSTSATGLVGLLPYNIVAGTWGSISNAAFSSRHNARNLSEVTKLRNGWLALSVERVRVSGTTINNAGVAPITNVALTTNVVTITAANNYVIGQQVQLAGLTSATFLNGVQGTVLSTGLSGTQFEFNFTHADYVSASDTGNAFDVEWQVLLFDPSTTTWNSNQITGDGTTNFSYGQPGFGSSGNDIFLTYEGQYNNHLMDVAQSTSGSGLPVILLQCNWRSNKLFVIDGSQSLASLSNSNVTNVSRSASKDIFAGSSPTAPSNPSPLQIRKSASDDRTLFWFNEQQFLSSTNNANTATPTTTFVAPPSWHLAQWSQSSVTAIKTIQQNAKDSNGNIQTFAQDGSFITDISSRQSNTAIIDAYSFLGVWSDNAVNVVIYAGTDSNVGNGEYGIHQQSSTPQQVFAHNLYQGTFYMPTYFKFVSGAFTMADSYADAVANPAPVPATAGTNVNLPYGLIGQFGQTTASSFGQFEWFAINVAWGNTKFVRKARYTWSMFAGQTFLASQTVPLTAANSVIPTVYLPDAFGPSNITFPSSFTNPMTSLTVSRPSSFVASQDGYGSCGVWPMLVSSVAQNAPVQVVMTVNHPDPTTIMNRPNQAGQTYGASSSAGAQTPVTNAFNGCPWMWQNFNAITGVGGQWLANAGAGEWIAIDLGSAATAHSYSFNQGMTLPNQSPNTMSAWTLQGSNNSTPGAPTLNVGTWTTIDTQSGVSPTRTWAGNVGSPASFRYYAIQAVTVSGSMALGFFRLFTSTMQSTFNFSEILGFGPQLESTQNSSSSSLTSFFMRGLTFEVSTDSGSTYTEITPFWRAHMGGIWCFPRQTAVTNVRITCQSGYPYYNINTASWTSSPTANFLGVGPFQFVDYQVSTIDSSFAARLGSVGASDGTPTRGSFDTEFMGTACDAVSISIDSSVSPASLGQQFTNADNFGVNISPVIAWWSFVPIPPGNNSTFPNGFVRVHPAYGFVLFGGPQPNTISGAGGSDQVQAMAGTNMNIIYQWGRRV